ncbi:MAG: class I SAM-dependent methyltransferase [Bacteriovoracaceae bacterium]|nr:class I SAM-dependent methyltransferase [Bacteriovoracaceae bacterium]
MSHFNQVANEWDSEFKVAMMQKLATETKKVLSLTEKINIMDFGCGTGLFGLEFSEHAKALTGIDTSEGMLEVFDQKTKDYPEFESKNINLEEDSLDQKFDLVISSMTFHHLNDPFKTLETLKSNLSGSGKIAIVDLDQEDGSFHPDNKRMGVKHFGFSKEKLSDWASRLDLKFEHSFINSIDKNDREYKQFLAVYSHV